VSRAGYYLWQQHQPSVHSEQDRKLLSRIQAVYAASEGTYGSPRIYEVLQQAGVAVSRKRVARLMREAGLRARAAGLYHANPGTHAFFTSVPNRAGLCIDAKLESTVAACHAESCISA
jgi:transposase InsO family protein